MYRLTARVNHNPLSTPPHAQGMQQQQQQQQQQRIYRWGPNWGIYRHSLQPNRSGTWRAEKRTLLESNMDQLFERVDILDIHAPPVRTDDVWDEEVIVSNNVEYNGLVSICATAAEIKRWCVSNKLPVLKAVEERAESDVIVPPLQQQPRRAPHQSQYGPSRQQQQHHHYQRRPPTAPAPRGGKSICLIDS